MPIKRRRPKARDQQLTHEQWLELTIGQGRLPAFEDEESRREAWELHRDDLVSGINGGKRPAAWWIYDAPEPRKRQVNETLQLWRLGQLTEEEVAEVMEYWRHWAEKAPTIHYAAGPGESYEGAEAERRWRAWAGVPDEVFPPRYGTPQ